MKFLPFPPILFWGMLTLTFMTFWACSEVEEPLPAPIPEVPEEPPPPTTYTFLSLGDSYTIGQGVAEDQRWPNQLGERLKANGRDVTEVNIIAQTGWTTTDLLTAIENEDPGNHDLVSILIGVNNQFQGYSFSIFETEFDELINIAINLAGGRGNVIVVSIPDYGVTPFGASNSQQIAEEIDAYNNYIADYCASAVIPFIDVTGISRDLGDTEMALAPDNLHPSGFQYGQWVEEILPTVLSILE
ncbi:MAG: SGNH/GDSL hydrolase family protein [Bacteroidota bacterium]